MKNKLHLIVTGLIFLLIATGCGRSKLEIANTELNAKITKSEEENVQLKIELGQMKQKTNDLEEKITQEEKQLQELKLKQEDRVVEIALSEATNTQLKVTIESLQKQVADLETNAQANKQSQRGKTELIKADIERILVRLKKVLREPENFNKPTQAERQAERDRLEGLANSEKSQVEEIIIDLEGIGFSDKYKLVEKINDFFHQYNMSCSESETAMALLLITGNPNNADMQNADAAFRKSIAEANQDLEDIKALEKPSM